MLFEQVVLSYSDTVVAAVVNKEKLDRQLICYYCLKLLKIHHYAAVTLEANRVLLFARNAETDSRRQTVTHACDCAVDDES